MAITQGVTGAAQTVDDTSEIDLWVKGTNGPPHTEWYFAVTGDSAVFKVYTGERSYSYSLTAGSSERVGIRAGEITKLTVTGNSTSASVTWWPTLLISG